MPSFTIISMVLQVVCQQSPSWQNLSAMLLKHFIKEDSQINFLYFTKAYDLGSDLLTKLYAIGVESKVVSWIRYYLKYRKQYVALNERTSKHLDVLSGVRKCSFLALILFLIYINDITCMSMLVSILYIHCVSYFLSSIYIISMPKQKPNVTTSALALKGLRYVERHQYK